jgi:hypothetical protein
MWARSRTSESASAGQAERPARARATEVRGERLSGVEIAATVFSNLREGNTIQTPARAVYFTLIAFFGLVLGVVARSLGPTMMLPLGSALMLLYAAAAYYAFSIHHLWLPLIIPLLVQGLVAIGGGLYWGVRDARREREQLQKTFGYYLPPAVVADLCERLSAGFAASLAAFRIQDFGQAGQIFEALLQEVGEDGPARFYLALCERYRRTRPAAPWDGTVYLDEALGREPMRGR